jgi:hypothetical protein
VLKYLKNLLLFALLLAFQAKGNTGYYPGTVLLHLDSIDNKLFKEQCSEPFFNEGIVQYIGYSNHSRLVYFKHLICNSCCWIFFGKSF